MKDTLETMEERLDKKFGITHEKQEIPSGNIWEFYFEIKQFINQEISLAISSHNKELVEKVEGLKKEGYAQYMASEKKHLERINFNEALDQVINLIRGE